MSGGDDVLVRHAVAATARHRGLEPAVRALAADVPPQRRGAWEQLAAALSSGREADVAAAAGADPACWIPLVAHATPAAALDGLAQLAARPPHRFGGWWRVLAYPLAISGIALVVLFFVGVLVLPIFDQLFDDFGLEVPRITKLVQFVLLKVVGGWGPLAVGAAAIVAGRFIMIRRAQWGPEVTATFTAALADLVAGGVAADDAVALAGRSVGARAITRGTPRRPLTAAASAALDLPAAAGSGILRALAVNHAARGRASVETLEWLIGPIAVGVAGVLVGVVVLALFMPLISLVNALS